jgi:predicted DNA-binding protein
MLDRYMDPVSLRLEDGTPDDLDEEYEQRGFRNRAVYLRYIIDHRDEIFEEQDADTDAAERLAEHDEQLSGHDTRLSNHDERLEALEEQARPFSWASRNTDSSP